MAIWLLVIIWNLVLGAWNLRAYAQEPELTFTLDVNSETVLLPKIFKPNIDLSGRGFHYEKTLSQGLASVTAINTWQKEIGFSGIYRLQYNLWEIAELAKEKADQAKLLQNYENIVKNITDAGGIVIVDIFGTPAGLGRILDKKSPPRNLKAFQEFIRTYIRELSCNKRYNVWYEVWDAPDLDDFFLGREQDYLALYKAVAQVIMELKEETKVYIPLGGPSASWWFQNVDTNNITRPERSLIYNLIKFCARNRLPLDFITWHAYSTDPRAEQEMTAYNKNIIALVRTWLSYFNLNTNIPLIVTEWNFDNGTNIASERNKDSSVAASFLPARLKNMHEAGLSYQVFFALEDFGRNLEGINRNLGAFWFEMNPLGGYKGGPKLIYYAFKLLAKLGDNLYTAKESQLEDGFVGIIATRSTDRYSILIYNYIDPNTGENFVSRNIATLHPKERKELLGLIKADKLEKIIRKELDISKLRIGGKLKTLLIKAQELQERALRFATEKRELKLALQNLKENYAYQKYVIDATRSAENELKPEITKEINVAGLYEESLTLNPYSLTLIILEKKPAALSPVSENKRE